MTSHFSSRLDRRSPDRRRRALAISSSVAGLIALLLLLAAARVWLSPSFANRAASGDGAGLIVGPIGAEDGVIEDGQIVDADTDIPAVTRLESRLRDAMRAASASAAAEGVVLDISSGWRSVRYQDQLFRDAVAQYGGEQAAREFVAPADRSRHVTGEAVDIGGLEGQLWLMEHGWRFGLCQTFANERWHFERVTEEGGVCPDMSLDARAEWEH